jgi:DegV family protein with EDD domain
MGAVRIITDSGADLATDTVDRLAITVVPLIIRFGQEVYLNGQLSADEFWHKVAEGPDHPGTSQPSSGVFEETFARTVRAGHDVLCLTITGKHSGTFSTASTAARRFGDKVVVMDSLSLSLGQGFQALAAARAAARGLTLGQVVGLVEQVRERSHLFILLDTVEYVRRGGRANGIMPILNRVTQMLRIKPILILVDGRLSLHSLARSYERGLAQIQREVARLMPVESLAVVHTRSVEVADKVARALADGLDFPRERILVTETGPLLSVHAGPKAIGVAVVRRAS